MSTLSDKFVHRGTPGDPDVTNLLSWHGDGAGYYTRDQASSTINTKKCTTSFWIKVANEAYNDPVNSSGDENRNFAPILSLGTDTTNEFIIYQRNKYASDGTEDTLRVRMRTSSTTHVDVMTRGKLRDPGQWTHICVVYDSTQSTDSDRVKIFINNERQTQFANTPTWPSLNQDGVHGTSGIPQQVGRLHSQAEGNQHRSIITDFYFLDGVAIEPNNNFVKRSTLETGKPLIPLPYDGDMNGNSFHLKWGDIETTQNSDILWQPSADVGHGTVSDEGTRGATYNFPAGSGTYGYRVDRSEGTPFVDEDSIIPLANSDNYISFPVTNGQDLDIGTGQFQIDFWIRFRPDASNSSGTGYHTIWDHGYHQAGGFKLQGHNSKLSLVLSYKEVGSTSWTEVVSDQANTLTEDTWYHYVVNRDSSGDVKLYRDASLIATSSSTHNDRDFDWTGTAYLGYSGNNTGNLWHHKPQCDIADFRFIKGGVDAAVASSNPTETKSTLTSNLKIALQPKTTWHGKIKNQISTGPTATLVGDDFTYALPFGDTSSIFSRGDARWGVHLDEHSDFNWGTDDFEISFWVMLTDASNSTSSTSNWYGVFWQGTPSSTGIAVSFVAHDGNNQFHPQLTVNGHHVRSDTNLSQNTWYFVSCGRKNGQLTVTVNDNSSITDRDTDSFTSSTSLNMTGAGDISIGSRNATSGFGVHNGWVTDFRVVKGSNSTNVITDSSSSSHGLYPMNGLTQQSTVKKFDGALDFGGNTPKQFIEINDHNDFNFGSGDFTIEGWIYPRQTSSGKDVIGQRDASATSDSSWLIWQNGNTIQLYLADDDGTGWEHYCTSPSISTNTWHHFAAVRNGSNIVVYIDGTAGTAVNIGTFSLHNSSRYVQVGGDHDSANSYAGPFFYGYMDDIRITKSAVYTSNFTAPTSALSSTNSVLHIQCAASDHTIPTEKASKVTGTKLLIQPEAYAEYKDVTITDSSDSSHTLTAHNDGPIHSTPHCGYHGGESMYMRCAGPHTHKRDSYSMRFWGGTKTPASAAYTSSSNSSYHAWTWDDDFCMKFWLKIKDSATKTTSSGGGVFNSKIGILSRGTGNHGYTGYLLGYSTEDLQLRLYESDNSNATSWENTFEWNKPLTWNRWYFVEVSKDGSNLYLFLDGELANSYTSVGDIGIAGAWGHNPHFNMGSHNLGNWGHGSSGFSIYNFLLDKRKGNTAAYTIPSTRDYVGTEKNPTSDSAGNGNFSSVGTTSTLIDTPKPGETYNIFHSQNWQGWEVDTDDIRNAGLGMTQLPTGSGEDRPVTIGAVWGASGRHCSKKYYWETQVTNQDSMRQYIGVGDPQKWSVTDEPGDDSGGNSWSIIIQSSSSGLLRHGNASDSTPGNSSFGTFSEGDICGIAWDVAGGKIWYSRNGVWRDGDPAQGTSPSHSNVSTDEWLYPVMCNWYHSSTYSNDGKLTFNFGQNKGFSGSTNLPGTADNTQDEFYYAPPSGFVAMKTSEMPAPVSEPNKYFDAVTYTGTYDEDNYDGTDPNNITGLQFQPGLIWIRNRETNASYFGNYGFDSVLGFDSGYGYNIDAGEWSTGAEFYGSGQGFYGISGVSSNGFSVDGAAGTNYAYVDYDENYNPVVDGDTYVAYCWKLGSTGSSTTWTGSGADPDTEHYNADTGISVIQKDNSSGSIGSNLFLNHSLGKKPAFAVFFDNVDVNYSASSHYTAGHYAWHQHLSDNKYLMINTNAAESSWGGGDGSQAGNLTPFPSSCSTTTTFKIGDAINISAIHCWLFAEVAGFSRFGYYEGRGDTPFYNACGFKPKFLMIKRIDSTGDWTILDSARDTLNTDMGRTVEANDTNDETSAFNSTYRVDFTSNGFVLRNTGNWCNNSSGEYIFMAFAHRPFSYSNGMGGS